MRTRIKICGITTVEAAQAAVDAGADAVGLVFVEKSPRFINATEATRIVERLPAFVEPVGLFVNQPVDVIRETAQRVGLTSVQLHGHEGPGVVRQLTGLRVIKGLGFEPSYVREMIPVWRHTANLHAMLWDTPPPPDAEIPGGTGKTFDWHDLVRVMQADNFNQLPPSILAGGLNPENVARAIELVHPFAVDVSSGVETSPGVKNLDKIAAFCQAVRRADTNHREIMPPMQWQPR